MSDKMTLDKILGEIYKDPNWQMGMDEAKKQIQQWALENVVIDRTRIWDNIKKDKMGMELIKRYPTLFPELIDKSTEFGTEENPIKLREQR